MGRCARSTCGRGRDDLATIEERLAAGGALDDERVLGDAVAAADATGVEPVAVVGLLHGRHVRPQGGGHRAVRPGGLVLRHGPGARHVAQCRPRASRSTRWPSPGACPVLAIAGTVDPWLPADDLDALEAAGVEVVRYEGADHGFVHDPSRPAHRPDDAADAWRRVVAHLGA